MSTISGIKTLVNTSAEVFAGTSKLSARVFMRVRNLDDSVACVVHGRTLEPGEQILLDFVSSTVVTVMGYSKGRAVQIEVVETA